MISHYKKDNFTSSSRKMRGSALSMALLFIVTLSLIVGSSLETSVSQIKYNRCSAFFSDRFDDYNLTIPVVIDQAIDTVTLPDPAFAMIQYDTPLMAKAPFTPLPLSSVNAGKPMLPLPQNLTILSPLPQVIGAKSSFWTNGQIGNAYEATLSPDNPLSLTNSAAGKRTFFRDLPVLLKVLAKNSFYKHLDRENYYGIVIQYGQTPITSYLIFTNFHLELNPEPEMILKGPLHANGSIFLSSGINLELHDQVTTAGHIYAGDLKDMTSSVNPNPSIEEFDGSPAGGRDGKLQFKSSDGNLIEMYQGSGSRLDYHSYYDSRYKENGEYAFKKKALELWKGNLLTSVHGVKYMNISGLPDYVWDDPNTPALYDPLNYPYVLIEKSLPPTHPNYKGKDIEMAKMANKASIVFKLVQQSSLLPPPTQHPSPLFLAEDTTKNIKYYLLAYKHEWQDPLFIYANPVSDPVFGVTLKPIDNTKFSVIFSYEVYQEDGGGNPVAGMYDARRADGIDLLKIDINQLNNILKSDGTLSGTYKPAFWTNFSPKDEYNGIIYLETPSQNDPSTTPDNLIIAREKLGIYMHNAEIVPAPDYNKPYAQSGNHRIYGFTFATDNYLYTVGHINADGSAGTGSSTEPDNGAQETVPMLLACDTIGILSSNWEANNSAQYKDYNDKPATFTELCFAVITGMKDPTIGIKHLAIENVFRLIEDWRLQTLRYRGSIAILYASLLLDTEVGTGVKPFAPPIRDWGFLSVFGTNSTQPEMSIPPGTPCAVSKQIKFVGSISKDDFKNINQSW